MSTPQHRGTAPISPMPLLVKLLAVVLMSICMLMMMPNMMTQPAGNHRYLMKLFNRHADLELSNVNEDQLQSIAYALSGYLAHEQADSLRDYALPGQETPAFSEEEILHLEDVKELFLHARTLFYAGLIFFTSLVVLVLFFGKTWSTRLITLCRVLRWAAVLSVAALLFLAVMSAFDFSSAFYLFHEVLFENDLWLMNPQTHLLIQLMPEPFFINYAQDFAVKLGIIFLFVLVLTSILIRILKARDARAV